MASRHVFISYVREDSAVVDRLARGLAQYGIKAWVDRNDIKPGQRWQDAIRSAIRDGAFFIACFSPAYASREKSYMNEELSLALAELRQYSPDRIWFIPVLLAESQVPDRPIGPGETLRELNWVELFRDWEGGLRKIAAVVAPDAISPGAKRYYMPAMDEKMWGHAIDSMASGRCIPILGPGINTGLSSDPALAQGLATEFAEFFHAGSDTSDLPRVAQRLADETAALVPAHAVAELLARAQVPDAEDPDNVHALLARLPFSLYLTTAYDAHLEEVLRANGRVPVQQSYSAKSKRWEPPRLDEEPTLAAPWVVHLRGLAESPGSLVLTDREQLRFFAAFQSRGAGSVPAAVAAAISRSSRFFIGFRQEDRLTEFILESLTARDVLSLREYWHLLPVSGEESSEPKIGIAEFMHELMNRWSAAQTSH